MLTTFARYWWLFVLRGVLAIIFGVLAFVWPGLTLFTLVILFGAYAFVDGAFLLVNAIAGWRNSDGHWLTLLEGLLGVGIGVITYRAPLLTGFGLLIYIAAWSLATGVLEIAAAIRLREELKKEWWLLISGIASVVFATVLMVFPAAGALGLIWAIATYAVVFGALLIGLGFKMFQIHDVPVPKAMAV